MQASVLAAFARLFGRQPDLLSKAPGRVNLLGEHTDYNEGFVLPAAIDRAAWVAASLRDDKQVNVVALDLEQRETFSLDASLEPQKSWSDYPKAVAHTFLKQGHSIFGLDAVLLSNVPMGAGLSSSAAVELAFAILWNRASHLKLTPVQLAKICQRAENEFVGMRCGIMDQMASALGKQDHALFLDCRTLETECVPTPPGIAIVVTNTKVKRELASSAYNYRRADCEQAVEILKTVLPDIKSLRDVTTDNLHAFGKKLPKRIRKRATHVITENQRVQDAVQALKNQDIQTFGSLMFKGHESLKKHYEVSCKELDCIVDASKQVQGCLGARLTGAGFGGCTVALVEQRFVEDYGSFVKRAFVKEIGYDPDVYVCSPSNGAFVQAV